MSSPTYFPERDKEATPTQEKTPPYEPEACQATEELQAQSRQRLLRPKCYSWLEACRCSPGRRKWNDVAPVALPFPGTNTQWPPEGWQQMSREERLLRWESVALSLAIAFKLPMSRGLVHDFFQFLVLPGSQDPTVDAKDGLCRHALFKTIRRVALGEARAFDSALIQMIQASYDKSASAAPGPYRDFLVSLKHVHLRLE